MKIWCKVKILNPRRFLLLEALKRMTKKWENTKKIYLLYINEGEKNIGDLILKIQFEEKISIFVFNTERLEDNNKNGEM